MTGLIKLSIIEFYEPSVLGIVTSDFFINVVSMTFRADDMGKEYFIHN